MTTLILNWNGWRDIVEYLLYYKVLSGGTCWSYRYLARLIFRCGIAESNQGSICGRGQRHENSRRECLICRDEGYGRPEIRPRNSQQVDSRDYLKAFLAQRYRGSEAPEVALRCLPTYSTVQRR